MTEWRNRIIEHRMVDASELQAHPQNPRRHPQGQQNAVRGLLSEVGIVDSLTVYDSPTYGGLVVLDGHLRKDMGGQWPVNVLDVTDEEAALILATFDFTTSLAELDGAALAELLGRVAMTPVEDEGVAALLAQLAADGGVTPPDDPNEHWQGMPAYEQDDLTAAHAVNVKFRTMEDLQDFARLVGQSITDSTRSLWYPEGEARPHTGKRFVNES